MNRFFVLFLACAAGIFTISQAYAQIAVFDFYFYLLPFGMALVSLLATAGVKRMPFFSSVRPGIVRAFPLFGAPAMLVGVALYQHAALLGTSLFFLSLIVLLLITYVSLWCAVLQEGRLVLTTAGFVTGLALGEGSIAHMAMDPLVVTLIACVFSAAVYVALLPKTLQGIAYLLIVCVAAFAVSQTRQYQVIPASLGWTLDYGKAEPGIISDRNPVKRLWGPSGLTEMYALNSGGRDAWLFTNGSSPALVPLGAIASYDDAWWAQKAPLAMAIYDAVQPKSMVDIGIVPSEMAWRAINRGARNIYGLYGSHEWSLMHVPGLDSFRKSVIQLHLPLSSAEKEGKFPRVDMIVLSSGHEGKKGWISSNAGEQTFLDEENIASYWQHLSENGVLVLLSRQPLVFFRQIFSVWAALKNTGMSDAEFLNRAWGVTPDTEASLYTPYPKVFDSPYRYALIVTKKAKDASFAQAISAQVLRLPVKYLFGYAIEPSKPYNFFYQYPLSRVQTIFTKGLSGMYGGQITLEASNSYKSIPYQFVEDVYPQYKNMLVVSVGVLIWIILFPLQKYRRVQHVQTMQGPSIAIWMVTGGMTGILLVVALAFLLVYPSGIPQEFRLLYLALLLPVAASMSLIDFLKTRMALVLAFTSTLLLILYLAVHFMQDIDDATTMYAGAMGIVLALVGMLLPAMHSTLSLEPGHEVANWWWSSMAAGAASALFWSMRLYSVFGDGLVLIAGLLAMSIAAIFWWRGSLQSTGVSRRDLAEANLVA